MIPALTDKLWVESIHDRACGATFTVTLNRKEIIRLRSLAFVHRGGREKRKVDRYQTEDIRRLCGFAMRRINIRLVQEVTRSIAA